MVNSTNAGSVLTAANPVGQAAADTASITTALASLKTAAASGPASLIFGDGTYIVDAGAFVIRSLAGFTLRGSGATVIQLAPNRAGQYNANGDLAVIADCTDFQVGGIRFDWNRDTVAPITALTATASSGQPSVTVAAGQGARYLAGQRLQLYGGLGSSEQSQNEGSALTIASVTPGGGSGGGDLVTFTGNLGHAYTQISSSLLSDGFGPYACSGAYLTPYQIGSGFTAAGRTLGNEDTQNALHLISCQRFIVTGCEFWGTWESPLKLGTGFAPTVVTDGCSEGVITGNRIQHGYDQGISVWNSSYVTVTANKCQAAGWAGISFTHSNDCTASGNICTGNIYSPASDPGVGSGIAAEGGIRVSISNNVCSANNYAGILLIQSPLYLANTTITAPASANAASITVASASGFQAGSSHTIYDAVNRNIRETIYVASVSGTTITLSPNLINAYASGSHVVARFGEDMRVSGNVCANNTLGAGIKAQRQSALCLFSNDCSGNGLQVETNASTGIWIDTLSDGATVEANTCRNNSDEGLFLGSLQQCVIVGNEFTHSGAPGSSHSGIKAAGLLDSVIESNKCGFNSNNGISLESDGSVLPAHVQVIGNQCYNNTQRGIIAGDGGSYITLIGNKCLYNTQQGIDLKGVQQGQVIGNQSANNGQDGLLLQANGVPTQTVNILVAGNLFYDDQGSPTQQWGIREVDSTASIVMTGNYCAGNNANYQLLSNNSDVRRANAGHNPAGHITSPSVPSSTSAYTNVTGYDCMVLVTGGTVSQIAIAGTNTGLTSGWFRVPALGTITLTYSAAPTWTWWAE